MTSNISRFLRNASVSALAALACCGCSNESDQGERISVSNLTVGLVRKGDDDKWHVYSTGNTFPLIPNGPCVVAEKEQTCMWYGFEFDYTSTSLEELLTCKAKFNKPTDLVTAKHIVKNDTAGMPFAIPLSALKGHYAQSAYVFRQPDDTPDPWTVEISCKHNERELFRFPFTALHEY